MAKFGDYRDFLPGGELYNEEEFRANEIQRGNETGTYATHGGSLDEIKTALAGLSKNPDVMDQLKQGHTEFVKTELAKQGLALPRHYALDVDEGTIVPRQQGKWERWKTPILLTAAMFGGGFALEAALSAGGGGALGATVFPQSFSTLPAAGGVTLGTAGTTAAATGATAAATGATAAATGAAAGGAGVLPATVAPMVSPGVTGLPAATGSWTAATTQGGGGGMNMFSRVMKGLNKGEKVSNALGNLSHSMANNRDAGMAASLDRDQINIHRQDEDRREREDSWRKLNQADYASQAGPITPYVRGEARNMPGYTPGENVAKGAKGLQTEVLKRLTEGSQLPPVTDVEKRSKMGKFEKLVNAGGVVASLFGR